MHFKKQVFLLSFFLTIVFFGCKEESNEPLPEGWKVTVLGNENLFFGNQTGVMRDEGVVSLNSGRILVRKVSLPPFSEKEKAVVKLRLASTGDEWDRMGSVFVCPGNVSFVDLEAASASLTKNGKETGFLADLNGAYQPAIELLHFCTPFGVGYYNSLIQIGSNFGISAWQPWVEWERDITELCGLLGREIWVGVLIDTWKGNQKGFSVNLEIQARPSERVVPKTNQAILPVVNTIRYIGGQDYYDGFATKDLSVELNVEKAVKQARLFYTVSGHGGHAGGDEFKPCGHSVSLNGQKVIDFLPWRADCKTFRAYNPTSGKDVNNNIWSSDLSRSNWCPGSKIEPEIVSLGDLEAGTHRFVFHIQGAQASSGDKLNFWCVSAYVAGTN